MKKISCELKWDVFLIRILFSSTSSKLFTISLILPSLLVRESRHFFQKSALSCLFNVFLIQICQICVTRAACGPSQFQVRSQVIQLGKYSHTKMCLKPSNFWRVLFRVHLPIFHCIALCYFQMCENSVTNSNSNKQKDLKTQWRDFVFI